MVDKKEFIDKFIDKLMNVLNAIEDVEKSIPKTNLIIPYINSIKESISELFISLLFLEKHPEHKDDVSTIPLSEEMVKYLKKISYLEDGNYEINWKFIKTVNKINNNSVFIFGDVKIIKYDLKDK